ncbi:MAG: GNAT family N-acetyltransferase [Deltaproteobacteria bacterium]|nr:GNAT family N-acetyltransferase [Deltaproteobacteria bacterium]
MADSQYFIPVLVDVLPASSEQQPVLANLLELYAHDFSEFMDLDLGADGRFGYDYLHLYWTETGRYPFLINVRGNLAGFALVRRGSSVSGAEQVMDMTEFFVARGFRRLGVGTKAAGHIFRIFPGLWQVRVRERNRPARAFWAQAVEDFTGKPASPANMQLNGELWQVFSF